MDKRELDILDAAEFAIWGAIVCALGVGLIVIFS